jgi:hypothetical protein
MKQREAVVQTIEKLWWVATLGQINHHIFEIKDCERKTQTPFASIRRIVQQTPEEIYKIKPWLYWLVKSKKNNEEKWIIEMNEKNENSKEVQEMNHYYYQWLLVEIWNIEAFQTYVPMQDQNKYFLNKKLLEITTISKMYEFGYEELIKRARTIDVIWFNNRKMPNHFYEVEHSTDIQNSLLKFVELQDFNSRFTIVANEVRKKEYETKLWQIAFDYIRNRVKFLNYDELAWYHTKTYEYYTMKNNLSIFQ